MRVRTPQLRIRDLATRAKTAWLNCVLPIQRTVRVGPEASADLRAVFNAPNRAEADRLLALMVSKHAAASKKLAAWLEDNVPEGLTVFGFPADHRRRLRTNNGLERLNREIKRRTRVASIFPNEASLDSASFLL